MSDLLPALLLVAIVGAAYLKIGLVLAVLRQGLGATAVPASVVVLLALVLSGAVMAPVAERAYRAMGERGPDPMARLQAGTEPLRAFLAAHAPAPERGAVLEAARRVRPPAERAAVSDRDLAVVAPAFALAQLKLACQIGFLLLLPFLVLDLLVGSLLQAFGIQGLSPQAVALPFKLLLFVLTDGWRLLGQGLLLGYA